MKKKAIIITDGSEVIQLIASSMAKAHPDLSVKIFNAQKFIGSDLLPYSIFILGCEKPKPDSFAYLEDFLSHINLASRKCGVFSTDSKAVSYLGKIVKSCEADLIEPLQMSDKISVPALKKWLKGLF